MGHNGPIIEAACADCPIVVKIRQYTYNINIKKNNKFICSKCAKKQAGTRGSYDRSKTRDLSLAAKELWSNQTYANQVADSVSKSWTDERKIEAADVMRQRWRDELQRQLMLIGQQKWIDANKSLMSKSSSKGWTINRRVEKSAQNQKNWTDPEFRQHMKAELARTVANQPKISSLQTKLYSILSDLKVEYHQEGLNTVIGHYCFDCVVPKFSTMVKGLLIECQGKYWHTLPKIEAKDKSKFTYINRYFPEYEILYIWEREFEVPELVKNKLLSKLGLTTNIVDFNFNDILIENLTAKDSREFIDAYHYIGGSRGGVAFGAKLNGELVACAIFSPPIRQNVVTQFAINNDQILELSRFCISPAYQKKNFASWFIAKILKRLPTVMIIAYTDTTVGHDGTIYKASNFKFHHRIKPDYWYVNQTGHVLHKKTLYERAIKIGLNESQFAEVNGYIKKYGGEKLCFIYSKQR